jgi:hypothetical protein
MSASFERTHFDTPRATEYFSIEELQAQTGREDYEFFHVALKELVDNGLDAAESANVSPEIAISVIQLDEGTIISVGDNGVGLSPDTIERILDFNYRTSDKAAYKAPTRGLQGNATKTLIGMPFALGRALPINIASGGIRHTICAWVDPAGQVRIHEEDQEFDPLGWAADFALFNPHSLVQIRLIDKRGEQSQMLNPIRPKSGKCTSRRLCWAMAGGSFCRRMLPQSTGTTPRPSAGSSTPISARRSGADGISRSGSSFASSAAWDSTHQRN